MGKRIPVHCPTHKTRSGDAIQIAQVGYGDKPMEFATYNLCRACHTFHPHTMPQMLRTWRQLANGDLALMRVYLDVLNKAVLDAEADMSAMMVDDITAAQQQGNAS